MNNTSPSSRFCLKPRGIAVALALGLGVGLATKNIGVGIAIAVVFAVVFRHRNSRQD